MKRVKMSGEKEDDESPCRKKDRLGVEEAVILFEKKILTNPLITDLVCAELSYSDLLNCSLVSKAWNIAFRGILVDGFKTYLTLSEKSTVYRLEDFYTLLCNGVPGHQQPVNGFRVKFETGARVWPWPFLLEAFADLMSRIKGRLEIKFLSFDMSNLHFLPTEIHEILKKIIIPHLETLEFLEILHFHGNLNFLSQQLEVDSLPNLKELDLHVSQERMKRSTFKRILRACPNLRIFPPVFPFQLPTLRYTNKLHLASKVRFNYMRLTPHDLQLLQDYGGLIKTLEMNQNYKHARNHYEGEVISRLQPLFSAYCQQNLESLNIDLELLVAILLQNTFPSLLNLKELFCRGAEIWFPCLFKNQAVRFAQFLPNLKSVTFKFSCRSSKWLKSKYQSGDFEDKEAPILLYKCQTPGSLNTVTTLKLQSLRENKNVPAEILMKIMDLDEVFPRVTHLDIDIHILDLEDILQWICESWGDLLKVLKLRRTKCLGFRHVSPNVLDHEWEQLQASKRKPLSLETMYLAKLSHLQNLELEFCHPLEPAWAGTAGNNNNCQEKVRVQDTFEPWEGPKIQVTISGCRAQKRIKKLHPRLSIYGTILALHFCPRNLELTPMEEIVANKSICTKICQMLPADDLLRCSLVNKSWSAAAREVLYSSRSLTLTIHPTVVGERNSLSKIRWLASGNPKLFRGLRIKVRPEDLQNEATAFLTDVSTQFLDNSELSPNCFKELEITGLEEPDSRTAPGLYEGSAGILKIVKRIVQKLDLSKVQKLLTPIESFERLFRDAKGNLLACNLKILKFCKPERLLDYPRVFKHLLEDLKCLERIEVPFSSKLLPLVTSLGKAHCVKHLQLYKFPEKEVMLGGELFHSKGRRFGPLTAEDPQTALGSLLKFAEEELEIQIESLSIGAGLRLHLEMNEALFGRIFQRLCNSSYNTLSTLCLHLSSLHLFAKTSPYVMEGLTEIQLLFYEEDFDPQGLLARIPFSHVFPNLEVVKLERALYFSHDYFKYAPAKLPAVADRRSEFWPCRSVETLEFKIDMRGQLLEGITSASPSEPWILKYVASVFPYVTNLSFCGSSPQSRSDNFNAVMSSIWRDWSCLEVLEIDVPSMDAVSFETWVLGISEEEWSVWEDLVVEEAHDSDMPYSMHYAPSSFSFRNCKYLLELRISSRIKTQLLQRMSRSPSMAPCWNVVCLKLGSSDSDFDSDTGSESDHSIDS